MINSFDPMSAPDEVEQVYHHLSLLDMDESVRGLQTLEEKLAYINDIALVGVYERWKDSEQGDWYNVVIYLTQAAEFLHLKFKK